MVSPLVSQRPSTRLRAPSATSRRFCRAMRLDSTRRPSGRRSIREGKFSSQPSGRYLPERVSSRNRRPEAPRCTAVTPTPSATISRFPGPSQTAFESTAPVGAGKMRDEPFGASTTTTALGVFWLPLMTSEMRRESGDHRGDVTTTEPLDHNSRAPVPSGFATMSCTRTPALSVDPET